MPGNSFQDAIIYFLQGKHEKAQLKIPSLTKLLTTEQSFTIPFSSPDISPEFKTSLNKITNNWCNDSRTLSFINFTLLHAAILGAKHETIKWLLPLIEAENTEEYQAEVRHEESTENLEIHFLSLISLTIMIKDTNVFKAILSHLLKDTEKLYKEICLYGKIIYPNAVTFKSTATRICAPDIALELKEHLYLQDLLEQLQQTCHNGPIYLWMHTENVFGVTPQAKLQHIQEYRKFLYGNEGMELSKRDYSFLPKFRLFSCCMGEEEEEEDHVPLLAIKRPTT